MKMLIIKSKFVSESKTEIMIWPCQHRSHSVCES